MSANNEPTKVTLMLDEAQQECLKAHSCVVLFLLDDDDVPVGHIVTVTDRDGNELAETRIMAKQGFEDDERIYVLVDVSKLKPVEVT